MGDVLKADVFEKDEFVDITGRTKGRGFQGGMTTRKYLALARCSRATAQREIADLVRKKILVKGPGGGRSASYDLAW